MVGTCASINVTYINPFLTSAMAVFRTMLACELHRGQPYLKGSVQPDHEISGVIGLSGGAIGTVVLSVGREVALNATEAMTGQRPDTLDGNVVDAVGELTNMIAGRAKSQLEQFGMSISLPNVILGKNHTVAFPSKVRPISIPFNCIWGPVSVDVGLYQEREDL